VRQGAEQVATAAEEQSAAVAEAQAAIRQQSQSLDQGQLAARSLTALSGQLRTGTGDTEAAAIRIGPMAEELSASIRQLSTAAAQIMSAVAQINRGARMQAAATQQRSAALAQIERGAGSARDNAGQAIDRVGELAHAAAKGRAVVDRLVEGVNPGRGGHRRQPAADRQSGDDEPADRQDRRRYRPDRRANQHAGGQRRGRGRALLIFPEKNSLELVRAVAGERLSLEDILELEHEALAEIGNIILNACIATVANLPRRSLSMSLPEIIRGTSLGLFDLGDSKADDVVLFVHINFSLKGRQVVGYVAMVMDFASLESLKELVAEFIRRMTE
jgi:hypothetical protein